jgi:hypothetical protein
MMEHLIAWHAGGCLCIPDETARQTELGMLGAVGRHELLMQLKQLDPDAPVESLLVDL